MESPNDWAWSKVCLMMIVQQTVLPQIYTTMKSSTSSKLQLFSNYHSVYLIVLWFVLMLNTWSML